MRYLSSFAFFSLVCLFLSACSKPEPQETSISIDFKVAQNINPDDRQRPSPLVVSLFELKAQDAFRQADFYSLFEHSNESLEGELISKRRLRELVPGIDRTDSFTLSPDAKYVGVLAEFVHYQQAKARLVVPVKVKADNKIQIELKGTELKIIEQVKPKETNDLQPVQM